MTLTLQWSQTNFQISRSTCKYNIYFQKLMNACECGNFNVFKPLDWEIPIKWKKETQNKS